MYNTADDERASALNAEWATQQEQGRNAAPATTLGGYLALLQSQSQTNSPPCSQEEADHGAGFWAANGAMYDAR